MHASTPAAEAVEHEHADAALEETAETAAARAHSYHIVLLIGVLTNCQYSLLMPTAFGYVARLGGGKRALSLTLAAFSFGRMVAFVPVGVWSDRRGTRTPLVVLSAVGALGNALYTLAPTLGVFGRPDARLDDGFADDALDDLDDGGALFGGADRRWIMLPIARLVSGVGAANVAVLSAWVARAYSPAERAKRIALNNATALLGESHDRRRRRGAVGVLGPLAAALAPRPIDNAVCESYLQKLDRDLDRDLSSPRQVSCSRRRLSRRSTTPITAAPARAPGARPRARW